ncbi:hypothetical protein [uncultured Sphingomonas sp.]|uniref:hypothetical protein n=1 Tax=uncultured Sphingomonas sp. TaxID=158754 RepID=UPI0030F9EC42
MNNWKPKKGDRITWRGKPGVVTDDYWADRDRFTIRLDEGGETDHGAESLRPVGEAK